MGLSEQTLNPGQMKILKSLGVDTTKASVVLIYKDEDGNELDWDDITFENGEPVFIDGYGEGPVYKEYFDAETGNYDHSYREDCGVFTLQDIIDILPKGRIRYYKEDMIGWLDKDGRSIEFYVQKDKFDNTVNPLDGAYKMLLMMAEDGYLNASNSMPLNKE